MGKSITLQTIADELGVSRTTVSNAFSRPDQLSDELQARILATAKRLGYTGPDPAACALRTGKAQTLGVVLTESIVYAFDDPYAVAFLRGLTMEAQSAGLSITLIPCPFGEQQHEWVRQAMVDSIVVMAMSDDNPVVSTVLERGLPTVFVDGPRLNGKRFVGIDDHTAMADATRRLLDLGHRRIGVFSYQTGREERVGPIDDRRLAKVQHRTIRGRLHGVLDTLADAGLDPTFVYEVGANLRRNAKAATLDLLSSESRPTAVLCLSDRLALGVLGGARELGLRVPKDLSIIGFDDIPEAERAGLSTVRQSAAEKSRAAWKLLAADHDQHVLIAYELVERATSGPPRPPKTKKKAKQAKVAATPDATREAPPVRPAATTPSPATTPARPTTSPASAAQAASTRSATPQPGTGAPAPVPAPAASPQAPLAPAVSSNRRQGTTPPPRTAPPAR